MTNQARPTAAVSPQVGSPENYGLHAGILGPIETLAQSVSAMAPSTSPSLTIPLVFALAGNATWFVYLLATCATLLVGFCVSRFAKFLLRPVRSTLHSEYPAAIFRRRCGMGILLAYLQPALRWPAVPSTTPICSAAIPSLSLPLYSSDVARGLLRRGYSSPIAM